MKKFSDTIKNRTRDLPVCSAVPQPLRHRTPLAPSTTSSQYRPYSRQFVFQEKLHFFFVKTPQILYNFRNHPINFNLYIFNAYCIKFGAGITQSVERLNSAWKVRGSNPGRGVNFLTSPDRPWGPPSLL
jgi:hypothetical protein